MDEMSTEYPFQDYQKIDQMLEERRTAREQTPRRNLDMLEYQLRKLIPQNKIELGLPQRSLTPH